ncbi:hypothetical protein [Allonocardiopsis opalescens]|uniref:Uncharacterized protein n=1 Tax=Allonocardiopsis opalescens TaxID=1144618 RepID=A0A2T0Q1M3_9ACTN|nr:hypothetical protein [Allonocardiopsis opalescens]PRX97697.1 hypothetical protein CLV72_10547 [Allonocardiopsis opalescens]
MSATPRESPVGPRPSLPRRLGPVLALFALSPICAEYLSGYHGQGIADLPGLLLTLLIIGPLYGTVALLIRELTRRTGRGWPTMLLLGAAFGLVQAGLIDKALFNHASFEGGPYWQRLPALVPGLDVDLSQLLVFVGGHMVWSFVAPIAVVEGCAPRLGERPWLGRTGLAVVAALYLATAVYFHFDFQATYGFQLSPVQLVGTVAAVAALVLAAFAVRRRPAATPRRVPPPWLVGTAAFVLLAAHGLAREPEAGGWAWPSIALSVLILALLGALLWSWSRRTGWTRLHVLAAAGAPLLLYAVMAFLVPPLEGTDAAGKYASNALFLVAVAALLAWARHRTRRADAGAPAPAP